MRSRYEIFFLVITTFILVYFEYLQVWISICTEMENLNGCYTLKYKFPLTATNLNRILQALPDPVVVRIYISVNLPKL